MLKFLLQRRNPFFLRREKFLHKSRIYRGPSATEERKILIKFKCSKEKWSLKFYKKLRLNPRAKNASPVFYHLSNSE
jgi:hypothetical protein